ncbi:hypothetical protein Dsin_001771 [Dipteronia sinensis]|uniref:Reverse transcriptase domain-containing protein n=1 Tax=Dipteronia sinensis TaxID=43782 RepID=A0AAE0B5W1_9ROSI|nr:hypothetical protein Dsin_001771 [Dipteronia sinensis]
MGFRQDDPLSPYMYPLVSEYLSGLINAAVLQNKYMGFRCCRSGPIISHLFFVDDSILFTGASSKDCLSIHMILVYSNVSGQVLNFEKSGICVSNYMSRVEQERLGTIIEVWRVWCHEHYLGLQSFSGRNKRMLFESIKDRIRNKIKGWRKNLLSVGGK